MDPAPFPPAVAQALLKVIVTGCRRDNYDTATDIKSGARHRPRRISFGWTGRKPAKVQPRTRRVIRGAAKRKATVFDRQRLQRRKVRRSAIDVPGRGERPQLRDFCIGFCIVSMATIILKAIARVHQNLVRRCFHHISKANFPSRWPGRRPWATRCLGRRQPG